MSLTAHGDPSYPPFELMPLPVREGDIFASFVEEYARAICERVLPSLELTPTERSELTKADLQLATDSVANASFQRKELGSIETMGSDCGPVWFGMPTLRYAQMARLQMIRHILNLGFSGLFHIFERQIVEVLRRLDYRRGGEVFGHTDPKRPWHFGQYTSALEKGGYPIAGETRIWVDRLRLISNAVKHGSPSSVEKLHKKFPELFWNCDASQGLEFLNLPPALLLASASVLGRYWREFPHSEPLGGCL